MFRVLALAATLVLSLAARADAIEADPAASPAVAGLWLTHDNGGVIAISPCGGAICARIAGVVLDHPSDPMPLDYRGVSQCGLSLITDAKQVRPALWRGHILDPRNGSLFGVELWLKDANHLALRGFLGISLLGRTEDWTRYTGIVPSDCRLLLRNASD